MRFEGKVALITGSTRGIGYATAKIMAREGARVVISSRKAAACEAVLAEFSQAGFDAIAVPCHVAEAADRERLVQTAFDAFGRIDIFVANAATNPVAAPVQEITDELWDKILETNLSSIWRLSKMILPRMAEHADGAMVAVSSIAALRPARVSAAYSVSKAAENHLVRNLADYWGPRGVRVNCVIPGATRTDMTRNALGDEDSVARMIAGIPLRRIGEPEDVGEAIAFLCSRAARQITGQMLAVDGGETMA